MTHPSELASLLKKQRSFFESGATRGYDFRREQLIKLRSSIERNEGRIIAALEADFRKPALESYVTEIGILYQEIRHTLRSLGDWMSHRRVSTPLVHFPSSSWVYPEPLGQVAVIGPWNYPFQLVISPVVGALAAGNTVILKPSELAAQTAKLIAEIAAADFSPEIFAVIQGGPEVTTELLSHRLDHVFFTGSTAVGRIIAQAAAKHLTPVTLELGGKSPCIIAEDADIAVTAKRVAWGKFLNGGQTCVAPDYVLVHRSVKKDFIQAFGSAITQFYGQNPKASPDFARIINRRHFDRLSKLIDPKKVVIGGETDAEQLYIAPTVMEGVTVDDPVMAEEIFGPILPVIEVESLDQAIGMVRSQPKPLALYFFSKDPEKQERVIEVLPFGGGCINDTLVHLGVPDLPFGGVGESGTGAYHGKKSFDTFTHHKSIVKKGLWLDIPLRYPSYAGRLPLIKKIFR